MDIHYKYMKYKSKFLQASEDLSALTKCDCFTYPKSKCNNTLHFLDKEPNINCNFLNDLDIFTLEYSKITDFNKKHLNKLTYFSQTLALITCMLSNIIYDSEITNFIEIDNYNNNYELIDIFNTKINQKLSKENNYITFACIRDKNDTHVMLVYDKIKFILYVIFRGTVSKKNIYTDIKMTKVNEDKDFYLPGKIHTGFYKAYKNIKNILYNLINIILSTSKVTNIVITGHSLGGALATLCALDISLLKNNVSRSVDNKEQYTFNDDSMKLCFDDYIKQRGQLGGNEKSYELSNTSQYMDNLKKFLSNPELNNFVKELNKIKDINIFNGFNNLNMDI